MADISIVPLLFGGAGILFILIIIVVIIISPKKQKYKCGICNSSRIKKYPIQEEGIGVNLILIQKFKCKKCKQTFTKKEYLVPKKEVDTNETN